MRYNRKIVHEGNVQRVDPTNPNGLWTLMGEIEIVKYENGVAEQKKIVHISSPDKSKPKAGLVFSWVD
tara:strand:+ start:9491 stop:9694 length:204 start_codon:yes stop_codon:yes gene_type:complete